MGYPQAREPASWVGRGSLGARLTCSLLVAVSAVGCEENSDGTSPLDLEWTSSPPPVSGPPPSDDGDCEEEGASVPCGSVIERFEDYVTCSEGARTCTAGKWGECIGTRTTQKPAASGSVGTQLLALGTPATCPAGFDVCDPYCNHVVDAPGGFTPGAQITYDATKFSNTTTGITPVAVGVGNCTSLEVGVDAATPLASGKWVVTAISPLTTTPANPLKLTLTALPAGCATGAFDATWTVDKVDRATISGTKSNTGQLALAVPIAGTLKVTAFAKGLVDSLDVPVAVNVVQTSSVAPNTAAAGADITAFASAAPTGATSTVTWLYPYANTYLPLGLPAPVLQYRYSNVCGNGRAVKFSLRYPTGRTAAAADFNYSIVVKESNNASRDLAGESANVLDPQVIIPKAAWQYFEQTARGNDAELIVQRQRSGNTGMTNCASGTTYENETPLQIHFVDGQLKGTVFYNSYTSPLGGSVGAVLKIAPGATTPTIAVQPTSNGAATGTRKCTVCHTLGLDGSKLFANTDLTGMSPSVSGGVKFNNSRRYDMTATNPSNAVLSTYTPSPSGDSENSRGDRYTYGAPWVNGTHYMTHGGNESYGGDSNWRAPNDYSRFYRLGSGLNPSDTQNTVDNWSNMSAVTPRFSPDGSKLAFSFWAGGNLPCSSNSAVSPCTSISGSKRLQPASGGTRLTVVDFNRPANANSTTGWSVTNARDVTPSLSPAHKVVWPSFTPDGSAVAYQRQVRAPLLSWSASSINTVGGALAEIWLSDVPANGNTLAKPTRLLALNGLSSGCSATSMTCTSSYLPTVARTVAPAPTQYHNNSTMTVYVPDTCSTSASATNVNDYQLNYLPYFNPIETGGHRWMIFSSRRMYGNIAYGHPWDAEPGMSCEASTTPSTKKLWVSAIDKTFAPGTDPSHPAFYLPGQELKAGNSNAYWVNAACTAEGATCQTNDDCCGGTGDAPTARCKVVSVAPVTKQCSMIGGDCSGTGEECATNNDCCTGLTCPEGGGTCVNVPAVIYQKQTLQREYIMQCPAGTDVKWRHFEWQATTPIGTSIQFKVQTKRTSAATYLPAAALPIATASGLSTPTNWYRGAQTTDQVLTTNNLYSGAYLLVTMDFNPDVGGTVAPILHGWRHIYDCVPAQ